MAGLMVGTSGGSRPRSHARTRSLVMALALSLLLTTVGVPARAAPPGPNARFPDLAMAQLTDFAIERPAPGTRWLRFTTIIANVGIGALRVRGYDPLANGELHVMQKVYDGGTWATIHTPARLYWSGDGHNHWHIRDLETYELRSASAPNAPPLRVGVKHGFCFSDNWAYRLSMPRAPQAAYYTSCGHAPADTYVRMGLSVGWGDRYGWDIVDQYIDISGLPLGQYLLTATADKQNWFAETNNANNSTTARIQIHSARVIVLDPGVGA